MMKIMVPVDGWPGKEWLLNSRAVKCLIDRCQIIEVKIVCYLIHYLTSEIF